MAERHKWYIIQSKCFRKEGKFSKIPLEEVAGKTKMVNVDNELIRQAESLGISLGRKA